MELCCSDSVMESFAPRCFGGFGGGWGEREEKQNKAKWGGLFRFQSDMRARSHPLCLQIPATHLPLSQTYLPKTPEHTSCPVFTFIGPYPLSVMPSPHLPHGNPLHGLTQLRLFFCPNPAPSQTLTLCKGLPICSHLHHPLCTEAPWLC